MGPQTISKMCTKHPSTCEQVHLQKFREGFLEKAISELELKEWFCMFQTVPLRNSICGHGSLKQCFLSLYEHVNHWWGGAIYKMCSPRTLSPQILINSSEIGTRICILTSSPRILGQLVQQIIEKKRVQSFLISTCTITKQRKEKALRACFQTPVKTLDI